MKIPSAQPVNPIDLPDRSRHKKIKEESPKIKERPAAIYERSEASKTIEASHVYDSQTIESLKKDSEQAHAQLIRLVEEMLQKQGKSLATLSKKESVQVDEATRSEAASMIGPQGPYGVEAVSDRLVDFAKAISGGDKSKAGALRSAINQGFKEAEKILGGLPQISKDTYKRTMEKLDAWVNDEA